MKKIIFTIVSFVYVTSSFGATFMPKFTCSGAGHKVDLFVSEEFLCGKPGASYDAIAMVSEEGLPMPDVAMTGDISYTADNTITARTYEVEAGKKITVYQLKFPEVGNEKGTLKLTIAINPDGTPVYSEVPVKCEPTVQYNVDCDYLEANQ